VQEGAGLGSAARVVQGLVCHDAYQQTVLDILAQQHPGWDAWSVMRPPVCLRCLCCEVKRQQGACLHIRCQGTPECCYGEGDVHLCSALVSSAKQVLWAAGRLNVAPLIVLKMLNNQENAKDGCVHKSRPWSHLWPRSARALVDNCKGAVFGGLGNALQYYPLLQTTPAGSRPAGRAWPRCGPCTRMTDRSQNWKQAPWSS
jgi:hypothetical protein